MIVRGIGPIAALPTAHSSPDASPATPVNTSSCPGLGLVTNCQAEPFHRSMSVAPFDRPTAHTSAPDIMCTPNSSESGPTWAPGTTVQSEPSQCWFHVWNGRVLSHEAPSY